MFDGRLYRRTSVRLHFSDAPVRLGKTHGRASLHRIIFKPQRQQMDHQPGDQVGDPA